MASTANAREIHNFTSLATQWWNEDGPMKPLHALNPVRMGILKRWLGGSPQGLKILDVGCGGGIVCEPLARMGAKVSGIDAGAKNIDAAKTHADASGLSIEYLCLTAEDFLSSRANARDLRKAKPDSSVSPRNDDALFDAVLALEIIEHVDDPALFVESVVNLCKPGGTVIFSTLNRTPKSFALGIVAAEYVLGWVPRGTHDWKKFKKPSELSEMLKAAGARVTEMTGLVYDPLRREFAENRQDVAVNYFLCATRES